MTRTAFEREMQELQDDVLVMGEQVAENLVAAVEILRRRDMEAAQAMIAADQEMNRQRVKLEMECLALLARQQPMAKDLRFIAATFAIVNELERMNDYAKGIARINIMIGEEPLLKPLIDIPEMARLTQSMLRRALNAFANRDESSARAIPREDDAVDDLYNQVFQELMDLMVKDPLVVDQVNFLLWAAHNLERAADRVTNICERVVYLVAGEWIELNKEMGIASIA